MFVFLLHVLFEFLLAGCADFDLGQVRLSNEEVQCGEPVVGEVDGPRVNGNK